MATPAWLAALNARSQGLNARYGLPPKKTKPLVTPAGTGADVTPPSEQFDPQAYAREQANQWLQAQLDSINAQKTAYLGQLQEQSDMEVRRGQAIAQALQQLGIPQQIQGIYGNASSDIGGLANAFAGSLRDTATKNAAEETRMVSGSGQEGAVRNDAEGLGNVVYGLGGYIPARNMSEQGAAFASQAAMEPGFATRIGGVKAADVYSQGLEGLKQFTDAILEAQGQVPDVEGKILDQIKPDISYRTLANGQIQAFDDNTGLAVGPPQGPKKVGAQGKNTIRTLANGQLQAFSPSGKPIGKPYGPKREDNTKPASLKTVNQGNKISLVDPYTGKVVKTFTKKSLATATKSNKTYQSTITNADGSKDRVTFDAQGNITNRTQLTGPKVSSSTRPKRVDGVTPTQARKYKSTAYSTAKAWHNNGEKNDEGQHFTPKELLSLMVNEGGIPYDIALSQLARWSPAAQEWSKMKTNVLTGQPLQPVMTKPTRQNASYTLPSVPAADVLPTSWTGTHVTDSLGWGTKTAIDLFPINPATGKTVGAPVGSPVSGTVVYFHPDGAQGGGSMLIRGDDGYEYWIGHIDDGVAAGTRVNRGSQIAIVSSRHPTPHVHIDRRPLRASV